MGGILYDSFFRLVFSVELIAPVLGLSDIPFRDCGAVPLARDFSQIAARVRLACFVGWRVEWV